MSLMFKKNLRSTLLGALMTGSLLTTNAYAATFANNDVSAAAAGVANAVVAGTGSITDALYNPAGLAWQEGVQAFFANQSRNRFKGVDIASGGFGGDSNFGDRQAMAMSWMPKGWKVGIAGSFSNPYDTRSDWSAAFPNLGYMNLEMTRYTVDAFWRVNNTLGVSVGLDTYDTSLRLNTGGQTFAGSDWSGIGTHVGLRWEMIPFWTIAAHYRQGIDASASDALGNQALITLPDELTIGVAYMPNDDELLWELDLKQSTWSALKNLNVSNNGVNSQTNAANLRDTIDMMLGLTWFWRHNTQLRFGYAYEQGANQEAGYQPLLSDLSGHKFSIGFGGEVATMHLDMTITGTIYNDLTTAGAYAGTYRDSGYNFLFSISKKF